MSRLAQRFRDDWIAERDEPLSPTLTSRFERALEAGADRERRRIRRAQADALNDLYRFALTLQAQGHTGWLGSLSTILSRLNAATKARKKGRK